MALTDILASIAEAVEQKKAEMERAHAQHIAEVDAHFAHKKEQLNASYESRVNEKIENMEKKLASHIAVQSKSVSLRTKHIALGEVFEKALEELCSSKDYVEILAKAFATIKEESGSVVYAKGRKKETEDAIKKSGKKFELGEEGTFKGGARVVCKKVEYDLTFENLVALVRAQEESTIAYSLFNA